MDEEIVTHFVREIDLEQVAAVKALLLFGGEDEDVVETYANFIVLSLPDYGYELRKINAES